MTNRGKGTAMDMVRSLAVIGIAVAFMFALSLQDRPQYEMPRVDVDSTVQAARELAGFPVLALPALPDGWRANAAYFEPVSPGQNERWMYHVGYVTKAEAYFGIDATNQANLTNFVDGYLFGTDTGATRTVAGLEFEVFRNQKQQMLVHRGEGALPFAIIITGAANPSDEQATADFERFLTELRAG